MAKKAKDHVPKINSNHYYMNYYYSSKLPGPDVDKPACPQGVSWTLKHDGE